MTDPNRPVAWRIFRDERLVAEFASQSEAFAYCQRLEPEPEMTGFRLTMEPVRPSQKTA